MIFKFPFLICCITVINMNKLQEEKDETHYADDGSAVQKTA